MKCESCKQLQYSIIRLVCEKSERTKRQENHKNMTLLLIVVIVIGMFAETGAVQILDWTLLFCFRAIK